MAADHDASHTPGDAEETLGTPAGGPDATIGGLIGPYRILGRIGAGGMGEVFLAEQREPVRRRVALKIVHGARRSPQALARFELERQALALLNHECIAQVLDSGSTLAGDPYFVMELVSGKPIDEYCDEHRLSARERIELVIRVCAGVQHAHNRGILHRDLKPGNILVVGRSEAPLPKIIDFGLARAFGDALIERPFTTEEGHVLGTPEYMAPEQARGEVEQIDTRTDVHALGVLLYRLLAGRLPFSSEELRDGTPAAIRRLLGDEDPPKPSTRLTDVDAEQRARLESRYRTELKSLHRSVRGDLDWIAMRAIARDPNRRYPSPGALADDLGRHLADEPVEAGPPSFGYRMAKLVRRNKAQCAAAGVLVAVLITALSSALVFANRAAAARELALGNERRAEEERARAQQNEQREQESARRANDSAELSELRSGELAAETKRFEQLRGLVLVERARAKVDELAPSWPSTLPAMDRWLEEDLPELQQLASVIEGTIEELHAIALPLTPEQIEADRRSHINYPHWKFLESALASLDAAQKVRAGGELQRPAGFPKETEELDAESLRKYADSRCRVDLGRRLRGFEPLALVLAERALERARAVQTEPLTPFLETLARAQAAVGLFGQAKATARAALDSADEAYKPTALDNYTALRDSIADFDERRRKRREAFNNVGEQIAVRVTYEFPEDEEGRARAFLLATLNEIRDDIESLTENELRVVEARRRFATELAKLPTDHPKARMSWATVTRTLAAADGEVAHEDYRAAFGGEDGQKLRPQEGLVPIGVNPVTKLLEFYDLRSAWEPDTAIEEMNIPEHAEDGSIDVKRTPGIVFVLLPGGSFLMGAQSDDPNAPHFDAKAEPLEGPVHEVSLEPFFLARHEFTQGQWARMVEPGMRPAPSYHVASFRPDDTGQQFAEIRPFRPVEQVSWVETIELLSLHGLTLPTEARWEYACRAGTESRWSCGEDPSDLEGFANIEDRSYATAAGTSSVDFDDGSIFTSKVGRYRANAFGLHDMHGNVMEWTLDRAGEYTEAYEAGTGLRISAGDPDNRPVRGGCFYRSPFSARSSERDRAGKSLTNGGLGFRAAREIQR